MIAQTVAIALGTLASEDLACIAAGVLVAEGHVSFESAVGACFAGIVSGDLALFAAGRLAGRRALRWPILRSITPALIERATGWIERRGPLVILFSRFSPGLRLPTYVTLGLTGIRAPAALTWFAVAAALWTPLLVGASALFGAAAAVVIARRSWLIAAGAGLFLLIRKSSDHRSRRNIQAFFCRKVRWEFWPAWAAYLPLAPYLVYLAVKYRSLTLFTAANPGIPSGGLGGESKWEILKHLSKAGALVAKSQLMRTVDQHVHLPAVLKPDIGERGRGVVITRSRNDVQRYMECAKGDVIVQEFVAGIEFGVFYCRYPNQQRGRILSITEKQLPELIGDGSSTIHDLILNDPRAFCIARTYLRNVRRDPESVPVAGERIALAEIGSHCRGAIFTNATHLNTDALECAIDRIAKTHPGFYFGRFDIRAESVESFQNGVGFKVLELNGVGAEMTHIYDPAIGIREVYRVMRSQWRMAFEIGAMNRKRGAQVMGVRDLIRYVRRGRTVRAQASAKEHPTKHRAA